MARLLPNTYGSLTPPGEVELFRRFQEDSSDGLTVVHSLDLAEHPRQICGEIDFLILVEGLGILSLEVKSHRSVSRRADGYWLLGNDAPDARGPFKQAAEAGYSVRNHLARQDPSLSKTVVYSAVCFPFVNFDINSVEWHPWQLIDARLLNSQKLSDLIRSILSKARAHLEKKPTAKWFDHRTNKFPRSEVQRAIQHLRPLFELFESPASRSARRHQQLKSYTEEQFVALDLLSENPRVLFRGPAGTGKTLIAIEAVRRHAIGGKRVLFLCYNKLLGEFLKAETSMLGPNVKTSTLHALLLELTGLEPAASADFWRNTLPQAAIAKLLEQQSEEYDVLVIDEAQDLGPDCVFDGLDLMIKGGLKAGHWLLFGDFESQNIFRANQMTDEEMRKRLGGGFVSGRLVKNCRNLPRIAKWMTIFGSLSQGYMSVLRPDDSVDPSLKFYTSEDEQLDLLQKTVTELIEEGFSKSDIVVLSMYGGKSAANSLRGRPQKSVKLVEFQSQERQSGVRYTTIHAFKGRESPAVIITDVDHLLDKSREDLLYTGASRAQDRLAILCSADAKKDAARILFGRA